MKKEEAFTIIELVVAIAIMAVLAALVAASVTIYINKSKNAVQAADMSQLFRAGNIYADNQGSYTAICGGCWDQTYINSSCASFGSSQFPRILSAIYKIDSRMSFVCADNGVATCANTSWAVSAASPFAGKNRMCADYTSKTYLSNNGSNDILKDGNSKCCCAESATGGVCP
jgi:prepilin-type N-terminal cleavage/methylation domain-containing protein